MTPWLTCLTVTLIYTLQSQVDAKGGGRSFPIASENFAIESFQKINPTISWDRSNFLIDLAGHHAHCSALHHRAGVKKIHRRTHTGETIVGAVDFVDGKNQDIWSVNNYIQTVLKQWETTNVFYAQIKAARHVGCSVKPGCSGQTIVSCLFSPGGDDDFEQNPPAPPETIIGDQKALAFTPQQYEVAEQITRQKWDRSHYLENLSGFETDCAMISAGEWTFPYMTNIANLLAVRIIGQYGHAPNRGSTPDALHEIIRNFKSVANVREVGCSIIPDCLDRRDRSMVVVLSCLYEEL